jgi:hypothetical protein
VEKQEIKKIYLDNSLLSPYAAGDGPVAGPRLSRDRPADTVLSFELLRKVAVILLSVNDRKPAGQVRIASQAGRRDTGVNVGAEAAVPGIASTQRLVAY